MSYILDALKKSETERQQGKAPGVNTIQPVQPFRVKKRSVWPYLLIIALLFNAGVLVALRPWEQKADPPPLKAGNEAAPSESLSPKAPVPVVPPAHETPPQGSPVQTAKSSESASPPGGATSPTPDPSPIAAAPTDTAAPASSRIDIPQQSHTPSAGSISTEERITSKRTKPPVKPGDQPPPESTPQRPTPGIAAKPQRSVEPAGTQSMPAAAATATPPERAQRSGPAARIPQDGLPEMDISPPRKRPREEPVSSGEDRATDLYDLPVSIRNEVPRLSVSFLAYSDRPEERMVTINGKRMREGDEVSSGLKLEEITPEGAILSWKGKRFRKGVF